MKSKAILPLRGELKDKQNEDSPSLIHNKVVIIHKKTPICGGSLSSAEIY
jgi:hypothetical protein